MAGGDSEQMETVINASNECTKYLSSVWSNDNETFFPIGLHQLLKIISTDSGYVRNSGIDESDMHYGKFISYLNSLDGEVLRNANVAFLKERYNLYEAFRTRISHNFHCALSPLDLSKPERVAAPINAWIEEKTNRKITSFINDDVLGPDNEPRLALANATSFTSTWSHPFSAENTAFEPFRLSDNSTVEVEMMKMTAELNCTPAGEYDVHVLQLPLSGDNLSFFILLPDNSDLENTQDMLRWHGLDFYLQCTSVETIDMSLPKFKIKKNYDFDSVLMELGLKDEQESANFIEMIDSEEWLNVNKIFKTGVLELNEKGVEAASGTIFTFLQSQAIEKEYPPEDGLIIYEMDIKSHVSNRFAKNVVLSKVKNTNESVKEAIFTVVLPETAFITDFVMEIDGKSYKSIIQRKDEAKKIYHEAKLSGKSAGLVETTTRDSNEFDVSLNLEPKSVAIFTLTYEEMLQRVDDQYELVLNIRPGQIVEKLNVEVTINESRPLKFVKTPPLRSGKEISKNDEHLKPSADIQVNSMSAFVKFSPSAKQQKRLAGYLATKIGKGFSGQFVVQYDVERDPRGGEVLLQDGYFVHFFAPNDLDPLPKHVVFVLDTSSSMYGRKISQLKDAMMSILNDIRMNDVISIIEFNGDVIVWDIKSEKPVGVQYIGDFEDPFSTLSKCEIPFPTYVNEEIISKAKSVVQKIEACGSTFIIGGLETALYLIKLEQQRNAKKEERRQPIIVFLTDGQPNVGIASTEEIVKIVTKLNFGNNKAPIFSLSLGDGADKNFLRKLSLKNWGFSRHIYEAADASLQLQAFYKQISSPLLFDVKFKYDSDVTEVTKSCFPIYFEGAELIVSGRCKDSTFPVGVKCCGRKGPLILKSIIKNPVTSLERLWAYLMVKNLLEESKSVEVNTDLIKRATELSLQYSFVTEVTSLVVVKPNEATEMNSEEYVDSELNFRQNPIRKKSIWKRKAKKGSEEIVAVVEELPESCEIIEVLQNEEDNDVGKEEKESEKRNREFKVDRPFIFVLALKKEERYLILFQGCVNKPLQ